LARYDRPLAATVAAAVEIEGLVPDGRRLTPVADDIFDVFRRQYAYDKTPLNAVVEAAASTDIWLREIVTLDAANGGERIRAHLFLPRGGAVPYQTIVFFPAADAFTLSSSRDMSLAWVEFILRSGRAVLYPVYKGTYERRFPESAGPNALRESRVAWSRDLGRALDYLETRPDIDAGRIGFYGVSAGGDAGVILSALEPRLSVNVLQSTGIWGDEAPESDAFNYAPRVRAPTLMLNGQYDFSVPLETAQRPLFRLLGPLPADKRHVLFDSGHALSIEDVAREALPWLDRYLGPAALPEGR
jgi:dipeptidyl aminopeptidase/acylaminoacyl peptidase